MHPDEEFYKQILDNLHDGVYVLDRKRKITYWNQGAEKISGYESKNVLGYSCMDNILIHVDENGTSLCKTECPVAATLRDGQAREADVYLHHRQGHRVPVSVRVTPILEDETIVGAVEVFSDNSDKIAALEKLSELERAALIDPLTGIGNRRFVSAEMQAQINIFSRHKVPFGLLFMDIDYFKRVNDMYGHATGDQVLQMIAATLMHNIRSYETAGRWGGEEFIVICINVNEDQLSTVAEKLRMLIEHSLLTTNNGSIGVTVSMGATLFRQNDTEEKIIDRADNLMYQSKVAGRNIVTLG